MSVTKRTYAVFLAFLMIAVLVLSPVVDVTNEHSETCCGCDCLICLVANAVSLLRDIFASAFVPALAFALLVFMGNIIRDKVSALAHATPIELKNVILS